MPTVIHQPTSWHQSHSPASGTKATCTQPAPPDGFFNIVTSISVTFCGGASAPTATTVTVACIDGGTGGTTYLWGPVPLGIPAVAGATNGIVVSSVSFPATAKTATTLEFSAGVANTVQGVSMEGRVSSDL